MNVERIGTRLREVLMAPGPNLKFEMDLRERLIEAYRQKVSSERPQTEDPQEIRRYNVQVQEGQRDLLKNFGESLSQGQDAGAEFVESYVNPQPTSEE